MASIFYYKDYVRTQRLYLEGDAVTGFTLDGDHTTAGLNISGDNGIGLLISGAATTGFSITSAVTTAAFTGISIAPVCTGQLAGATGISIDYNYSGGDINAYGIDVDIQQTGETSGSPAIGSRGNIQGIRSDARVAYTIDDAYAVRGSCYVLPAATEAANDCIGVFATIQHTGTITRGATTSSFCAMKADVSNGSTGSWEGNMFNLMMGYGSSVNYGATSAIIYGYTHADARADYGLYLNNYSPHMLAGIRLGETTGASPVMESALWISNAGIGDGYNTGAILLAGDQAGTALALGATTNGFCAMRVNCTFAVTGGAYFFGKYSTYTTSAAMVDGFIMGTYDKVTLAHVGYENYATRGRMVVSVAQTGNTGSQYIGVFGAVEMASGAHALLDTGGCYGVLGTANLAGGSLDQPLIAGYFDCNPLVDVAGGSYAVRARMQNHCDYGVEAMCQTDDAIAGIHVLARLAGALPVGILFTGANDGGQGTIAKAFKFAAATNCGIAVNTNTMTLNDTSHHIVVDIAGTDYYIPIWDNATWT